YVYVSCQCLLQWPDHLTQRLLDWIQDNDRARVSGDRQWTKRVAEEFDAIIRFAVGGGPVGSETHLLATGHGLSHEEVVSILRNRTAGDLGSMARCIEVIAVAFANTSKLQERVRTILNPRQHSVPQEAARREFVAIAEEMLLKLLCQSLRSYTKACEQSSFRASRACHRRPHGVSLWLSLTKYCGSIIPSSAIDG